MSDNIVEPMFRDSLSKLWMICGVTAGKSSDVNA